MSAERGGGDGRAATGKVARLPFAVRNELCERLLDGEGGAALLRWLNGLPETRAAGGAPVNAQNLSAWRRGGYRRWLAEREKTRRLAELAEQAGHIAAATGDPAGVGSRLLLGRILEVAERADEENIGALVRAVAELRRGETAKERNELARGALELERARFQRQTVEMFIEWAADERAREIAASEGLSAATKTETLGPLLFGDLWRGGPE